MLERVPLDIFIVILSLFDTKDLLKIRIICKEWKSIIDKLDNEDQLFKITKNNRLNSFKRIKSYHLQRRLNGIDYSKGYGRNFPFEIINVGYFHQTDKIWFMDLRGFWISSFSQDHGIIVESARIHHVLMDVYPSSCNQITDIPLNYDKDIEYWRINENNGQIIGKINFGITEKPFYECFKGWSFFIFRKNNGKKMYWILDKQWNGKSNDELLNEKQSIKLEFTNFNSMLFIEKDDLFELCIAAEKTLFITFKKNGEFLELIEHNYKVKELIYFGDFLDLNNLDLINIKSRIVKTVFNYSLDKRYKCNFNYNQKNLCLEYHDLNSITRINDHLNSYKKFYYCLSYKDYIKGNKAYEITSDQYFYFARLNPSKKTFGLKRVEEKLSFLGFIKVNQEITECQIESTIIIKIFNLESYEDPWKLKKIFSKLKLK